MAPISLDALLADPRQLLALPEDQWFDRKGSRVAAKDVAKAMTAFANAEGGILAIGASTSDGLGGLAANPERANDIRQAALNHTDPPVRHRVYVTRCVNNQGDDDEVLILEIEPSERAHALTDGSVWLRVGDETRRLDFDQAQQLRYDKGMSQFDGELASSATFEDLNERTLEAYRDRLRSSLEPQELLGARGLYQSRGIKTGATWAGVLLFGVVPQQFYPNAYVRLLRYEGVRTETGARMNVVHDQYLEGTIPEVIEQTRIAIPPLLRTRTRLARSGRFEPVMEYPEGAWFEAVINALTHRSYTLQGDHIRIALFDDRMEVESPGRLPGLVRPDNIRTTRYSRNPRIARVLVELGYVRELGEGVDRMFDEMAALGLPAPEFRQEAATVRVTLYNELSERFRLFVMDSLPDQLRHVIDAFKDRDRLTTSETSRLFGVSRQTATRYLAQLRELGLIDRIASSPSDPTAYWRIRPFADSAAEDVSVL